MNIEKEIFKKTKINYNSLIPYGFKKIKDSYILTKNILDNTFKVEVVITKTDIKTKVIDLSFNEEYTLYKLDIENGSFTSLVKEEVTNILLSIKNNCTTIKEFIYPQTNRLAILIKEKYGSSPEFPWKDDNRNAIYRHKKTKKWYALIMNINRNKLDNINEDVEVMNIKLDPLEIKKLIKRKCFYKAYHMNKEKWITILLNNQIKDEEIMSLLEKSYNLTNK